MSSIYIRPMVEYDPNPTTDNGPRHTISDVLSANVKRDKHGMFELTAVLANTEENREYAADKNKETYLFVKTRPEESDLQAFYVTRSRITNNQVELTAKHISARLANMYMLDVTAETSSGLLTFIRNHVESQPAAGDPFSIQSDSQSIAGDFRADGAHSVFSLLFADNTSLLETYGGYIDINNKTLTYKQEKAAVPVVFRYGVNLLSSEYKIDTSNYIQRVYAYWKDKNSTDSVSKYVNLSARPGLGSAYYNTLAIDFSSESDTRPDDIDMRRFVSKWAIRSNMAANEVPTEIKIDPLLLYKSTEGEGMAAEDLTIGTAVRVIDDRYGVDVIVYVTSYTYDIINERYTELTLSNTKAGLSKLLAKMAKKTETYIYK